MYCSRDDLKDHVLDAYLTAAEGKNPGCVERHMGQVSAEIDEALGEAGYNLPLPSVPAKLRHVASVISAWRIVGNITSLMASEGSTGNEWIPLQTQFKQALKDLEAIRTGDVQLFSDPEPVLDRAGIEVVSEKRRFDHKTWSKF